MYRELITVSGKNKVAFTLLRFSLGIVYLWFGALKFFAGVSPAEQLAVSTIHRLTFGLMSDHTNLMLLATWECSIGIMFIVGKFLKPTLAFMLLHMVCTFTPFVFFPQQTFNLEPYGLTLLGQYIIKNLVFIAAGIVLWTNIQIVSATKTKGSVALQNELVEKANENEPDVYENNGETIDLREALNTPPKRRNLTEEQKFIKAVSALEPTKILEYMEKLKAQLAAAGITA